jgi:hypothetical protein
MELQSITQEIHSASQRLSKGADALFILAKDFAEAEKNYRQALGKEIVLLKDEGKPATLIPDIARGNCAELKFARDMAEFKYTAGRDALRAVETQVSALQSILRYQDEVKE